MASVATASPTRRGRGGSVGWAFDETVRCVRDWQVGRRSAAFLVAGMTTVLLVRVLQLPGGVLPALPVLLMPLVPHSPRLLVKRLGAAAISSLVASLISETFAEQPWILVCFAGGMAYLAFYLLGRGLDIQAFTILLIVPILYVWDAANGLDSLPSAWMAFRLLGIGLVVSSLAAVLIGGDGDRRRFKIQLARQLRSVPIRSDGPGADDSTVEERIWSSSVMEMHETTLRRLARELGTGPRYQNLETAADAIRFLFTLHDDKYLARRSFTHPESIPASVRRVEGELDEAAKRECELIADALEEDRVAAPGPDLDPVYARSLEELTRRVTAPDVGVGPETREYLANLRQLHLLSIKVLRVLRRSTGPDPVSLPPEIGIPRIDTDYSRGILSWVGELFLGQERFARIFALKGTIAMLIAFAIASVYSGWSSASSLLLLSMLVTTVNQGALYVSFLMRTIGLLLAAAIALLVKIVLTPDIDDIWSGTLLIGVVLLPGAILFSRPSTVAAGLNYSMGAMFIFSVDRAPGIALDPISDRVISVAGATLIPWTVFTVVRPVYARDRIAERLRTAMRSLEDQWRLLSAPLPSRLPEEDTRQLVEAVADTSGLARQMSREVGAGRTRWATGTALSESIDLLFILGRELEFRTGADGTRWLEPEERSIAALVATTVRAFADRIHDPGDPRCPAAIATSHRAMGEIEDRLEGLGMNLRATIAAGDPVDENHPGFLALLRQVMSLLHRIDDLLETRTKQLETSPRIAVGV